MLLALRRLFHTAVAHLIDVGVAHFRHRRTVIHTTLFFHLQHDMLQHLFFILLQRQLFQKQLISFDQLGCRKPYGDPCIHRVILDQMHHCMNTAVYGTAMIRTVAKILHRRCFLIFRHMDRMMHQFIHTLILCCRDRHDRHAQHLFHCIDVHIAAVADHLIHHIECYHHRQSHLEQLHRQIQIPPDTGHIHDIYDRLGLFLQDKIPGNDLFTGIRRHGIDARQVRDQRPLLSADLSILAIDRNPRKVSDMLVRSGQLVKQRGLSAVLVADQCKGQRRSLRQGILRFFFMIASFFPQTRMLCF